MSCSKNKKKLLGIFPYKGKHKLIPYGLGQHPNYPMFHRFYAVRECTQCGCKFTNHGLSTEEVKKMGFTENTILNTYTY